MSMKINGLKDLHNEFEKLQRDVSNTVEKYDGQQVSLDKLFDKTFMEEHTRFSDFNTWISAGGFQFETQEEFDDLPEDSLNTYVSESTDFDTFQDMLEEAGAEMLKKELGW